MSVTCSRVQRPEERVRLGVGVDRAGDVGRLLLRDAVDHLLLSETAWFDCGENLNDFLFEIFKILDKL